MDRLKTYERPAAVLGFDVDELHEVIDAEIDSLFEHQDVEFDDPDANQVASEFNFGFGGEPIERERPYAYRGGACVECGCADGGHYGDCQAVN